MTEADEGVDYFISYTGADVAWAEFVDWHLRAKGRSTVMQRFDFRSGESFLENMRKAAARARQVVCLLSPRYLASRWAMRELDSADYAGKAVLFRVEECEPEGTLAPLAYFDLFGIEDSAGIVRRLFDGVDGLERPRKEPPIPRRGPAAAKGGPARLPGTPPPIWNVQQNRNLNFSGRDDVLERLHRALRSGQAAALTQTLKGLARRHWESVSGGAIAGSSRHDLGNQLGA